MARLKGVEASPVALASMFKDWGHTWMQPQNGLPDGAEFLYFYERSDRRSLVFVFQHESFDDLYEGQTVPVEEIMIRTTLMPTLESVQ